MGARLEILSSALALPIAQQDAATLATLRSEIESLKSARGVLTQEIEKRYPTYANLINPAPGSIAQAKGGADTSGSGGCDLRGRNRNIRLGGAEARRRCIQRPYLLAAPNLPRWWLISAVRSICMRRILVRFRPSMSRWRTNFTRASWLQLRLGGKARNEWLSSRMGRWRSYPSRCWSRVK